MSIPQPQWVLLKKFGTLFGFAAFAYTSAQKFGRAVENLPRKIQILRSRVLWRGDVLKGADMNLIEDLLSRATLSEIEYEDWLASEAGQIVKNCPLEERFAQVFMWPVYFGEGVLAAFVSLFPGRNGAGARIPDDWMAGHRTTNPLHMNPKQLARAVIGAEGRQFFWLMLLTILGTISALGVLVAIAKVGAGAWFMIIVFAGIFFGTVGALLAGVAERFFFARRNMVRLKQAAAYGHVQSSIHGQARDVPLRGGHSA